jgi:hypothetical protein
LRKAVQIDRGAFAALDFTPDRRNVFSQVLASSEALANSVYRVDDRRVV